MELIFKIICCSGVFIGFYRFVLQREKMFRFNRFYLLATLVLSFCIPFMELGINPAQTTFQLQEVIPVQLPVNELNLSPATPAFEVPEVQEKRFNWWILVPLVYLIVTLLMLLRFFSNIVQLLLMARLNHSIKKEGFTLVSVSENISAFSFIGYLFAPANEIRSGRIHPEIFRHERAHIRQKHSWDILLVEFLKISFWFNPFLFLYKKSMQINHEFLADAEVLSQNHDAIRYQQLLLEKISAGSHSPLTSPFNYLATKKRFIMMTKKTSKMKTTALKLFSIPLLVVTMFAFSEKVSAQAQPEKGVSKELFRKYKKQIRKSTVKVKNSDGTKTKKIDTKNLDTELLTNIYNQMSDEQKIKVTPLPQNKNMTPNFEELGDLKFALSDLDFLMSDLNFIKSDIDFDISDLSFDLSDLNFSIADLIFDTNSPEFQKKIKDIEDRAAEIEKYYDSPEFRKKIEDIEKTAAEIEKKYDSPEFKNKIREIEIKAAEIEKYYDSPEFKNKIREIEKQAEQIGKEAEKEAKEAEEHAQEERKKST